MSPVATRMACAVPRCPNAAVSRGRCPVHRQGTTARGYGAAHQSARTQLAATLPVPCGYGCGQVMTLGSRWVAAHRVDGRPEYGYVASCVSCNERAKRDKGWASKSLESGDSLLTHAPFRERNLR